MKIFAEKERSIADAIAKIGYCNPFLPERIALEQQALGSSYVPTFPTVHWHPSAADIHDSNFLRLRSCAESLADSARHRLVSSSTVNQDDLHIYEDVALYLLYSRYMPRLDEWLVDPGAEHPLLRKAWRSFSQDFDHYLRLPNRALPSNHEKSHAFAVLTQLHRAFMAIYDCIVGSSTPIIRLRAAIWQSIFSHDMRRYHRTLYRRMNEIPTLILGQSGTGKELVARAIGLSRYVPFDAEHEEFSIRDLHDFHPLNLSALASNLIESELFGHRRGAFSGAVADRAGWLEECRTAGTIFLDEIGDMDLGLQVKLLRVLQTRIFQRVGETKARTFAGKIIAATNRNLSIEIREHRFREDLYFRLCADLIETPTLKEQLSESPDDLRILVAFLAQKIIPDDAAESSSLADEAVAFIRNKIGDNFGWPGNIRELEQCVRNVLIRGSYLPHHHQQADSSLPPRSRLARLIADGELSLDQLIRHYTALSFAQHGSYTATAEHLKINWRTVREKLDQQLVAEYLGDQSEN